MSVATDNLSAPLALRLEADELQIWRARESDIPLRLDDLIDLLRPDERSRAESFRFDHDRRRFVFCRSALRRLIGSYVGQPPGEIAFSYGRYGKPALPERCSHSDSPSLHFNLSHTKGRFLFVFSRSQPVGIDVEAIEPERDWDGMARHFFHPNECRFLQTQPDAERVRAGYALWTCKEAVLKARGDGVGGGLEKFEVLLPSSAEDEPRLRFDDGIDTEDTWLQILEEGPGFAAAVATLGRPNRVRIVEWHNCEAS